MGDLHGCWRRYTMPRTIRRNQHPRRVAVRQLPLPRPAVVDYFPPPLDPEIEEERAAQKRWREGKDWTMGEGKDIVGTAPVDRSHSPDRKDSPDTPFKARRRLRPANTGTGVLGDLAQTVDQLDRAIEVKLIDLDNEPTQIAENHVKLGLLRGASALIRRAKAMLEDYGKDLNEDLDPATDAEN